MHAFGAEVILRGRDFEEARRYSETAGVPFVEDGQEPRLSEGAGTIAEELLRFSEPIADVVVSLGNGAMLGGIARWIKAMEPRIRPAAWCPAELRAWSILAAT